MFPFVGTETLPADYSGDIEAHIPLLSLEGTNTWFRPPPKSPSSSSSQPSSSRASVATSATSVANYKTLPSPSATALPSHSSISSEVEIQWDRKYETFFMSLWSLVYFSTLLLGILLLILGCLGGRVWPKVVGGVFVGLHLLVCVGMVVVEAHLEGMNTMEEEGEV